MAKRQSKRRRRPAAPPPGKLPRERPAKAPDVAPPVAVASDEEDLSETYGYVGRDLRRIAVLGVLLFAAIYASQYILLQ